MNDRLARTAAHLRLGLGLYTRIPVGGNDRPKVELAEALWTGPLAGVAIGLVGALAYAGMTAVGAPPFVAAGVALGAILMVTGCLHEDGLADVADGFGGGATRERKLEIMHDSRIGSYGICALTMALLLRASALAALAAPINVLLALVAAHAAARAVIPAFMGFVPPARKDGLSAGAGRPPGWSIAVALGLGLIALGAGLGPRTGLMAAALVALGSGVLAWLCRRQIGGQTGDVLGALQQVCEVLVLISAVLAHGAWR